LEGAINTLNTKIEQSLANQAEMKAALEDMKKAKTEMTTLLMQMQTLDDAIPGAFNQA